MYAIRSYYGVYAELYELQKTVQLEEDNLEILNTYKELALSKFKNAKGTMVDVVRIDIKRNESLTNIQILKERYKPLQIEFNSILNRDVNELIAYPDDLPRITSYNVCYTKLLRRISRLGKSKYK